MKQKIELHDSQIEEVIVQKDCIKIVFNSLVILNVTDKFGFEFDKTTFSEGVFTIKQPQYKKLPTKGDISTGHLRVGALQNLWPGIFSGG